MRHLGVLILPIALIGWGATASASDPLPDSGAAKLAAYQVCRPLAVIDMGQLGSESSTECDGIVKNADSQKAPDNLAIRCLENTTTRSGEHKYYGSCVQTDDDGDKLFMTYQGAKTGQFKWIGGTGKYKGVEGSGGLGVVVAPGPSPTLFAYTLTYDVTWTRKK